jgi:hypothetical protein
MVVVTDTCQESACELSPVGKIRMDLTLLRSKYQDGLGVWTSGASRIHGISSVGTSDEEKDLNQGSLFFEPEGGTRKGQCVVLQTRQG